MPPRLAAWVALILMSISILFPHALVPRALAAATVPFDAWLIDTKVAIQFFDCGGKLCGRIVWLKDPLDPQGVAKRDTMNPALILRQRPLCGPTIIWDLRPKNETAWGDGWLYNPDDGQTYRIAIELTSADVIAARIYVGFSLFGESKTLVRIPLGTSAGWC